MQRDNEYHEDEQSECRKERSGDMGRSQSSGSKARRSGNTKKSPTGPGGVRQRRNKRLNW